MSSEIKGIYESLLDVTKRLKNKSRQMNFEDEMAMTKFVFENLTEDTINRLNDAVGNNKRYVELRHDENDVAMLKEFKFLKPCMSIAMDSPYSDYRIPDTATFFLIKQVLKDIQ